MIALPFILNSLFNFAIGLLVAKFLGAAEYGRYALALSIAVVLQTLALDWLRLSATRFYSEADRVERPEIRATLNVIFAGVSGFVLVGALVLVLSGVRLPLSRDLVALGVGTALANACFEFSAALVRARFLNRAYGTLVLSKNLLSLALSLGGAWVFGSAAMVLAGLIVSIAGSLVWSAGVLRDRAAAPRMADRRLALRFVGYAIPIVLANVLYQLVPMTDRALLSSAHGFAQAGQLALAFEMGIRIVGAIGSTLDVLLFQMAVLAERTLGIDAGRDRVSRNMGLVFAIALPVVAGCWLILPSFERLVVPQAFQGPFAHYFALMLPAMLCFALSNYCVAPAFQIAERTLPMIIGGLAAFAANAIALLWLPATPDATTFALAQTISSCVGFAVLIAFLTTQKRCWPAARDIGGALAGTALMLAVVTPLRALAPGFLTLTAQALLGILVYALVVLACDVARSRAILMARIKSWAAARAACAPPVREQAPAADGSCP